MKIGIHLNQDGISCRELRKVALEAENFGLDSYWVLDHLHASPRPARAPPHTLFFTLPISMFMKGMTRASYVPYDDETHRKRFFELNLEYLTGLNELSSARHGIEVNPGGTVLEYVESVFPSFAAIKPPDGIICILEVDGKPEGMGVLKKLENDVGEIKRMYVRSWTRGNGYGKGILKWLEERAKEFGFSTLRLDTAEFAEAAVHMYRKAGFKKIQRYSGGEWDERSDVEAIQVFMEKDL